MNREKAYNLLSQFLSDNRQDGKDFQEICRALDFYDILARRLERLAEKKK